MSLNTSHANGGVLIHAGEYILLYADNVVLEFPGQATAALKGSKTGRLYLTTHRVIFNNIQSSNPLASFSIPFCTLTDVHIEQPVFGANYIRGKVRAQPGGNWEGEARFKLRFKKGGAIDFAQAMLKAAQMAARYATSELPPYLPPSCPSYGAPAPAYAPEAEGYQGWSPGSAAFPDRPPPNTVFMTDNPPPYPGIAGQPPPPGTSPPRSNA